MAIDIQSKHICTIELFVWIEKKTVESFTIALIMHEIELKKSIVSLLDNGILHIHFKAGSEILLSDAILIVEAMEKVGKGKKYPVLIDAGEFVSVDQEVRLFSASGDSNMFTLADAIAYSSFAQKLIADFYVKNNIPVVPTRAFSTKDEAMEWLKTFIKK